MNTRMQISLVVQTTVLSALVLWGTAGTAAAQQLNKTYVGTFSNPLSSFGSDPANNPGQFVRGGKYVVKTSYDVGDIIVAPNAANRLLPASTRVVQLNDAPGSGGNTYELFIPSQGFNQVLTQNGQDHFFAAFPDITKAPTAEIQFYDAGGTVFRGFEFESNFIRNNSPLTPLADDIIFEQFTADVNFGGTNVTNYVVNILDGGPTNGFGPYEVIEANGGHVDVLSQSSSASGGQLTPGVFFTEAVPVIAEAGTNLVYDAGTLSVTTNAGTELVTESVVAPISGTLRSAPSVIDNPTRQADNDLGAGRTDKEDFLTFQWTIDVGGLDTAVTGNIDGTRLNRKVETLSVASPGTDPHGSRFYLDGTRTVEDVNISIPIENSGLQTTVGSVIIGVDVAEGITGLTDSDTLTVSYANANPVLTSASGTTLADNSIQFGAVYDDPDLVINSLIPGFETLMLQFKYLGVPFLTGAGTLDATALAGIFGPPGTYNVDAWVSDTAGAMSSHSFNITVMSIPEPSSTAGLALLATGFGATSRSRRRTV